MGILLLYLSMQPLRVQNRLRPSDSLMDLRLQMTTMRGLGAVLPGRLPALLSLDKLCREP
jgi:hypothetical protein